jgi:type IV secretory pathway VirJ component
MSQITPDQLAQLLVGIARAQQAIIDAIESQRPGFKGSHLASTLARAAHVRSINRPVTLADLPARVLMQTQGRNGPNVDQIVRDLEALLAGVAPSAPPAPVAPPARPAAPAKAAAPAATPEPAVAQSDNDLDMTKF